MAAVGRVLAGDGGLTDELHSVVKALLAGQVPDAWAAGCYPGPAKLGLWLDGLEGRLVSGSHGWITALFVRAVRRATFLRSVKAKPAGVLASPQRFMAGWAARGRPAEAGAGAARTVWLGGLFSPEALGPALLREHAKAAGVCPDPVRLRVRCRPVDLDAPRLDGPGRCVVTGLRLHGAAWGGNEPPSDGLAGGLAEAEAGLSCTLPPLQLEVVEVEEADGSGSASARHYACPVFLRVEFLGLDGADQVAAENHRGHPPWGGTEGSILLAELPTAAGVDPTRHWELRGVCASIDRRASA